MINLLNKHKEILLYKLKDNLGKKEEIPKK